MDTSAHSVRSCGAKQHANDRLVDMMGACRLAVLGARHVRIAERNLRSWRPYKVV